MLDLSGLKTLSQSSAAALAQWNPVHPDAPIDAVACALNLNGLEVAPLNVLEKLAAWSVPCDSASLMLNGLHELNPASAQVLARLSCASFIGLELANVCAITPDSAGALCDGGITWLRLGLRTITPETAAVLGASMIDLISLPKLDRIEAASIYGLAGLGPTGELPEDEGTRSLRNRSLELGDPSSELQDLGPGIKEALEALQQLDVEVIVSPRTADFLAKIE